MRLRQLVWAAALGGLCCTPALSDRPVAAPEAHLACARVAEGWKALSRAGAPAPTTAGRSAALWTGSEAALVHYGDSVEGAFYEPCADRWSAIAGEGAPAQVAAVAWLGDRLLAWSHEPEPRAFAYDRAAARWQPTPLPLAAASAPALRGRALVFAGDGSEIRYAAGTAYELASGARERLAAAHAPSPRAFAATALAGDRYFVFGGWSRAFDALGDGAVYDAEEGRWRPLPRDGAPSSRAAALAAATPEMLIVWGGREGDQDLADGAVLDLTTRRWRALAEAGAPPARANAVGVLAGRRFAVVAGDVGAIYDLDRERWRAIEPPVAMEAPWTIASALADGSILFRHRDGRWLWRLDPAAGAWTAIARPDSTSRPGALLSTSELLVDFAGGELLDLR
jgi:hypothetical protein